MVTMLTILEHGDEVAIASPYYFNHHMAIELAGGVVREIPLGEETGFQMRMEDVEAVLTDRTRAVVIVSPNNPTGAVYHPDEIATITRELTTRGIYVISDDAYEVFCYDGARHTSPAKFADSREYVITLGSLSKTFGMTGWRIGYMASSAELIRQALKVQDAMAICAPIISQVAATAALGPDARLSAQHDAGAGRSPKDSPGNPGSDSGPELAQDPRRVVCHGPVRRGVPGQRSVLGKCWTAVAC